MTNLHHVISHHVWSWRDHTWCDNSRDVIVCHHFSHITSRHVQKKLVMSRDQIITCLSCYVTACHVFASLVSLRLCSNKPAYRGKEECCALVTFKRYLLHSDLEVSNIGKIHSVFSFEQYSLPSVLLCSLFDSLFLE